MLPLIFFSVSRKRSTSVQWDKIRFKMALLLTEQPNVVFYVCMFKTSLICTWSQFVSFAIVRHFDGMVCLHKKFQFHKNPKFTISKVSIYEAGIHQKLEITVYISYFYDMNTTIRYCETNDLTLHSVNMAIKLKCLWSHSQKHKFEFFFSNFCGFEIGNKITN